MKMLAQMMSAVVAKPRRNITTIAIHCVVSTGRKVSWSYQSTSA